MTDLDPIPRRIHRLHARGGLTLITRALALHACNSTQDECLTHSRGSPGLLVTTSHQLAGRGRLGRNWQHEKSLGLAATFSLDASRFDHLTVSLASGVAACIACERAIARSPAAHAQTPRPSVGIKWPNDIVERTASGTRPRKLAGVLIERKDALLLAGIGINIAQRDEDFHGPIRETARSLAQMNARAQRATTLIDLAVALDRALQLPREQLLHAWSTRDTVTGRACTIEHNTQHYTGIVRNIDPNSSITLESADGVTHTLPTNQSTIIPGSLA